MTQDERLDFLLRSLLAEREEYADISIPDALSGRRRLLRMTFRKKGRFFAV